MTLKVRFSQKAMQLTASGKSVELVKFALAQIMRGLVSEALTIKVEE